jgi:hypothetical protein
MDSWITIEEVSLPTPSRDEAAVVGEAAAHGGEDVVEGAVGVGLGVAGEVGDPTVGTELRCFEHADHHDVSAPNSTSAARSATPRSRWRVGLSTSPPRLDDALRHAVESIEHPAAFLDFTDVFGDDLRQSERFADAFVAALSTLRSAGVASTVSGTDEELRDD